MKSIGIEAVNMYGCSLFLNQINLAKARGEDPEKVVTDFLIDTRSLNPLYEDAVTMGANAAKPLINDENKKEIGMLIVGTESSVDFGKPISTNIHGALGLYPQVRNYEVKHACYSGVAALDIAVNWVASGLNNGKKALVISSDSSRMHLNKREEFVLGGAAAAVIVSDNPKVIRYDLGIKGTWTTDVYDTFRPSSRHEVGNNEISLFTYVDALEGSYRDYLANLDEEIDFDTYFKYNTYHTPFPGMSFQAHRTLCNMTRPRKKAEIKQSFQEKVMPTLKYARRVGSTYGASNFVGLCGLIMSDSEISPGDRIGFFSYGSGAIGEYYSGILCDEARKTVEGVGIQRSLDARREVSVEEYERIEGIREKCIENSDVAPDFSIPDNWYEKHYEGNGLLVLKEIKNFNRNYQWS